MNTKVNSRLAVFSMASILVIGLLLLFIAPAAMAAAPTPQQSSMGQGSVVIKPFTSVIHGVGNETGLGETCMDAKVNAGVAAYDQCVAEITAKCINNGGMFGGPQFEVLAATCHDGPGNSVLASVVVHCWGNCLYR